MYSYPSYLVNRVVFFNERMTLEMEFHNRMQVWKINPEISKKESVTIDYPGQKDTSGGIMVSKLDQQTFTSEFEFHWVPYSFGLVPHQNKKLRQFQLPVKKLWNLHI